MDEIPQRSGRRIPGRFSELVYCDLMDSKTAAIIERLRFFDPGLFNSGLFDSCTFD